MQWLPADRAQQADICERGKLVSAETAGKGGCILPETAPCNLPHAAVGCMRKFFFARKQQSKPYGKVAVASAAAMRPLETQPPRPVPLMG